jgi:TonB family protein
MSRRQARVVATLSFVVLLLLGTTERAIAPGPLPWASPPLLVFYSQPPKPPKPPTPAQQPCYAVGFPGAPPLKIVDRRPVYPAAARAAGVTGVVIVSITIDEDGKVINPRILRSIPLLDQAALDAVNAWKFSPARLHEKAVCVTTVVAIQFPPRQVQGRGRSLEPVEPVEPAPAAILAALNNSSAADSIVMRKRGG